MRRCLAIFATVGLAIAATGDLAWVQHVGGVAVTDKAGKIVSLDLRAGWVTDSDMPLLAGMAALKRLDLSLTRISDRGLRELKSAPAIEDLNLYFTEQISDEGTVVLKGWKHLKRVNLRGTKIADSTLDFLAAVPALEWLDVGFAEVSDSGLDHLSSCTNLRWLMIGGNKLTDAGLQFLRQLPQIEYLDVSGVQRTDSGLWSLTLTEKGMEAIASVTGLRELRLAGTAVTATGIGMLKPLAKLERLDLQGCRRLKDDSVSVLGSLSQLKSLDLKDSGVSAEAVTRLRASLPNCKITN